MDYVMRRRSTVGGALEMFSLPLMRRLSSMVNLIAVTTLLLASCLHCYQQKTFKHNTNYFRCLESAFCQPLCLRCSFKLVNVSKSYSRKQKRVFFSEHSVGFLLMKSTPRNFVCGKRLLVAVINGPHLLQNHGEKKRILYCRLFYCRSAIKLLHNSCRLVSHQHRIMFMGK